MIKIAAEDVCDAENCEGCASELASGEEVASGYHECPLGRENGRGGSDAYRKRVADAVLVVGKQWTGYILLDEFNGKDIYRYCRVRVQGRNVTVWERVHESAEWDQLKDESHTWYIEIMRAALRDAKWK